MTTDPEPVGSPLTAVRRTSRGPSAGFALIAVLSALAAALVLAVVAAPPPPAPSPSTVAIVSPSPSAAPGSPTPAPSPTAAPATTTVIVLRGVADPAATLGALTGCTTGRRETSGVLIPGIQPDDVDAVAEAAGRDAGWIFVPPGIQASSRVWLGEDLVDLALAVGQQVVAVDPQGDVWLGSRAGGTRWIPIATPGGRTAWVMARDAVVGGGDCRPWTIPTLIGGLRSVTCAGLAEASCVQTLDRAIADIPDFLFPGGDATVSVDACRVASTGCSNALTSVLAAPPGWPLTTTALHAGLPDATTGRFTAADERMLPTSVLDALRHPSLPLPRVTDAPGAGDCSQTLTGELRGSPWDPRVAWVANVGVVWPSGTSAWFVPSAIVEVIGKTDGTAAHEGDQVQLAGSLDASGRRFTACTMQLSFASRPGPSSGGEVPAVTPGAPSGRGTGS